MGADPVGDCFANRDVGNAGKKRSLNPVVPGDFTACVLQPGLMDNQCRLPQEQGWNEAAQADVVLKKNIAPAKKPKKLDNGRPTSDAITAVRS